MAIEYLVYADASLDLATIAQAAIDTGDFESAEPYRDFICLNAPGAALQMRLEDSEKFSVVCAGQAFDFVCKTLIFFRLSKDETDIGQISFINFLRILIKYTSINIVTFNNEENETPILLVNKGKYYIYNNKFWSEKIRKTFPEFNLPLSKIKLNF